MTDPAKLIELADYCDKQCAYHAGRSRNGRTDAAVWQWMQHAANAAIVSQHLRAMAGRV
jgi:hypothetical protein